MEAARESGKRKSRGPLDFLKSRGKAWLLVAGVVVGVLLLLIGTGYGTESEAEQEPSVAAEAAELESYCTALEKQIAKLCDAVGGVSGVEVLVTLGSGYRTVYVTDSDGDPVTVGSGSSQQALRKGLQPPAVIGVAIVCNGGDDPVVQHALTDLISTSLGITANRVCVAGK